MTPSEVNFLSLPNEILLSILKNLNNIDVLYSLFGINNERLDLLVQTNIFTNNLNFASITDLCLINRFYNDILPEIHHNVKFLTFDPSSMERILVLGDYPNLNELKILHFRQELVPNYFKSKRSICDNKHSILMFSWLILDESLFKSNFRRQITNLILVNDDNNDQIDSLKDYTRNVYGYMLRCLENLKKFTVVQSSDWYPRLSFDDWLPNLFSSSTLTDLCIDVNNFDDCLYLLDGRLQQLTNLSVNVDYMEKSIIIHKRVSFDILIYIF